MNWLAFERGVVVLDIMVGLDLRVLGLGFRV